MEYYTIRLKRCPDKFVAKRNPSYAVKTDGKLLDQVANSTWMKNPNDALCLQAHWFTTETYAKVWTNKSSLKRFLSYCADGTKHVFSEYEILLNGNLVLDFYNK